MSFIHASNVYYFNGLVDTIDYDNLLAEYELNNKTLKAQKDFFIGIEDIKKKHIADIKKVSWDFLFSCIEGFKKIFLK